MPTQVRKIKLKVKPLYYVGGHPFRVILTNNIMEDKGRIGEVDYKTITIKIAPHTVESQKTKALIHEFIHVVNQIYNLEKLKESDVMQISEGLNQIFSQMNIELDWTDIKEEK